MVSKRFESGVADYVTGYAVVEVHFPIDFAGRVEISCWQCPYFARSSSICQLNKEMVAFPQKYVGYKCPLIIKEREDEIQKSKS